ncbi:MBG domain-containing protein, partial [Pleomorphovibrio marinus]|uniref:MBG domain-containing protein n=1 Tax=Pleomorphovibrio marinus TaxID=2164132 RepID=UPI001E4A0C68
MISHPSVPSWKTTAEVTIGGVVYVLTNGGNGGWAFSSSGGFNNSSCLHYSTAATTSVNIRRKDGERFQFYGVWLKYTNSNHSAYTPPYLTVNYIGSSTSSETYGRNTTVNLSKDENVTSVSLMFSGLFELYLDNLIVGPAKASAPSVNTSDASNVAGTMAILGGNVTNDGGGTITERGVVYGISPNPTVANTKTTMGNGSGAFSSQVSGLSLTTTYYARAYAINSAGTSYGNQITFTTTDGSGPLVINPVMDSAIDDQGNYPNDNTLYIGNEPNWGYGFMEGFMKFIIPHDLTGSVQEAKLRVNVNYSEGADIFLKAFGSNDDSWVETTATVPSKDHPLGQTNINSNGWVEIDVTSFVQNEFNGDKIVTLVLNGNNNGNSYVGINSRESTNKPELVLSMASGPSLPTVSTAIATDIGSNEANLGGTISDDGGATILERGIVWSTSSEPTTSDNKVAMGEGVGAFSQTVSDLPSSSTIIVRAYGVNAEGTSYGSEESFVTLTPTVSIPSITSTPVTSVPYDQEYLYNVVGSIEKDQKTSLSAPTLPAWLSFNADGQGTAAQYGDIPEGERLSGVAGDESGNIFAIRQNGTEIFKIAPDGTTTSWKSGLISSAVYALHIANGYVYIPRYLNFSNSITRIPLNNPAASEEVFLTRQGGILSLTDKDGFIYATNYSEREILKINETTKNVEVIINSDNGVPVAGPFGLVLDDNNDIFIATYTNYSIIKYDGNSLTTVIPSLPNMPTSIRLDALGSFYISMANGGVRKYTSDFSSFELVSENTNDDIWSLSFTSSGALVYSKFNTNEVFRLQTGAVLTGTPTKTHVGDHPVVLRAENTDGYSEQEFTITVTDENPPVVTSYLPAKNETEVELQPTLTLSFDEKVVLGDAGYLTLNDGGAVLKIFDLSIQEDRDVVELSGDQLSLSIVLDEPLPLNTKVSVGISPGFVKDEHDNDFVGFAGTSKTWTFNTFNRFEQIITFPEVVSKSYGDGPFLLGDEKTDTGLPITYIADDSSILSISGNQATILKAGTVTITATQEGDDTHFPAPPVERTLTIGKVGLTITADDQSKVYGEENPELTFTYQGLVNEEDTIADPPGISTVANVSSGAGTYPITLNGGSDDNYDITLNDGELAVTKAALSITADDQSKVYGEENPSLTFTYFGLVNGDTEVSTAPGISTTALASSGVGTYPISLDGGSDDNYDITLKAGELEVTKASLTITADDQSKVYGEENPSLTFTYFGLVNGDTEVSTEPGISTTALASSGVGSYPIALDGGSDDNYDITLKSGELTISKAPLTITADDQSKVYGEENPSLTFTYFGLVNGDTDVSTEPGISTTALASSGVGTYPVSLDGGSDDNYDITLKAGELEVTKASLTITANDQSRVYGEENPALTFSYDGLVNGDTEVSTEPGISTTALASSGVGTYPVSLDGGSDDNYDITLKAGELEVTKASLTITADDQSKVYGEENPSLTFTYFGLVNGD